MHATFSWHMVYHVFILVDVKVKLHWILIVVSLMCICINVYNSYKVAGYEALPLND